MARWRKVEVGTWNDEGFKSFSQNARMLWLYLLTGPRTMPFPGLVIAREVVIADDLGWSLETFRKAFAEAYGKGMAKADWSAGIVVLTKALLDSFGDPRETAKPESPNVLRSWSKSWDDVPDCELKVLYLKTLGSFAEALGEGFQQAFREAFRKALAKASRQPSPNQEKEKEQEKDSPPNPPQGGSREGSRKRVKPSDPTPDEREATTRILAALSKYSGIAYRGGVEHTRLIVARLRDGRTDLELRKVAWYCAVVREWKDKPEMQGYLRPETLFGAKNIEKYLDAAISKYRQHFGRDDDVRAAQQQALPAAREAPLLTPPSFTEEHA
jgi:uncharacterized phage protein (TIGR02220 family)